MSSDPRCSHAPVHAPEVGFSKRLLGAFHFTGVFWYRFHEWNTPRNFLAPLSEFLAQQGRRKLRAYLSSKPDLDLNEVGYLMQESFRGLAAILVLDDLHKASDGFVPCLSLLLEVLERNKYRSEFTTSGLHPE